MLDLAARLAYRATGYVEPNPLVGCVICRPGSGPAAGRIIGMGHHRRFGDVHAEVDAIRNARSRGHDVVGSTAYVTLEPCATAGKQPPCVNALIEAKVSSVVIAQRDPHPTKGGGAAMLERAGVSVEWTSVSERARRLSQPFVHRLSTVRPWVIAKWAQSSDGFIARGPGLDARISGGISHKRVHALRARVDAILIGARTLIEDQPRLTPRNVYVRRNLQRLVLLDLSRIDARAHEAIGSMAKEAERFPVCVIHTGRAIDFSGRLKLEQLWGGSVRVITTPRGFYGGAACVHSSLKHLRETLSIHTLMIEGGAATLRLFLDADAVDEGLVYTSPVTLGSFPQAVPIGFEMERHAALSNIDERRSGEDVVRVYRRPLS